MDDCLVALVVVFVSTGFIVGLLSSLIGIGGGVILVPILRLAGALSPVSAVGTSLFSIIFTSASGAMLHGRGKTCILSLGIAIGIGGMLTSPIGAILSTRSSDLLVTAMIIVVVAWSICKTSRKVLALRPRRGGCAETCDANDSGRANLGQAGAIQSDFSQRGLDCAAFGQSASGCTVLSQPQTIASLEPACSFRGVPSDIAKGVLVGMASGLIAGYVGIGGAMVTIPLISMLWGVPMRLASGTSLVAVCLVAIPGAISHAIMGNVQFLLAAAIVVGSIPGSLVGQKLHKGSSEFWLQCAFLAFLLVAAVMLVVNEISPA